MAELGDPLDRDFICQLAALFHRKLGTTRAGQVQCAFSLCWWAHGRLPADKSSEKGDKENTSKRT